MNLYPTEAIREVVEYIQSLNGQLDKASLSEEVKNRFDLAKDRSLYFRAEYSIKFCSSQGKNMSNIVVSLSKLKKYDEQPFIVCIVTPEENFLLLGNTSFLNKVSHSSQLLRVDRIRGSILGSNIMKEVAGLSNEPVNFEALFLMHQSFTFAENLERLVESTGQIVPKGKKFMPDQAQLAAIRSAPQRADAFLKSRDYRVLKADLDRRIAANQSAIVSAVSIDNINIRGRLIEYLITTEGGTEKEEIIDCLQNGKSLPKFITENNLGDYSRSFEEFDTETEIKTKALFLNSNPKGYNIDKVLAYLSSDRSVYLIYVVGVNKTNQIKTALCSVFDEELLKRTSCLSHWAGRNSRGVTQFFGDSMIAILNQQKNVINLKMANDHIEKMLALP